MNLKKVNQEIFSQTYLLKFISLTLRLLKWINTEECEYSQKFYLECSINTQKFNLKNIHNNIATYVYRLTDNNK